MHADLQLIDGQKLSPVLDRVAFVKYAMTGSTFLVQPERLPIHTAMVGVIITYPTQGLPRKVTCAWDLWSDRIRKIPTDAIDPAGPFPSDLTPEDNVQVWNNFLKTYKIPTVAEITVDDSLARVKIPAVSAVCLAALLPLLFQIRKRRRHGRPAGRLVVVGILLLGGAALLYPFAQVAVARPPALAPRINDREAVVILENLLKNIYRSFDFRKEEDVYDRLATSVSGELLSRIYLQNRQSMVVTQAGGAQARVQEVEILDVRVNPMQNRPLGIMFRAQWAATGSVGHWGHVHIRKNQYDANITVEPMAGAWKITGLELIDEKRVDRYGQLKS